MTSRIFVACSGVRSCLSMRAFLWRIRRKQEGLQVAACLFIQCFAMRNRLGNDAAVVPAFETRFSPFGTECIEDHSHQFQGQSPQYHARAWRTPGTVCATAKKIG